jgi:phenylalanyl-tRNA synthetase alpha chain
MPPALSPEQLARDLSIRDLSDPAEGAHAIQLLVDVAVAALISIWDLPLRHCRGPRVVPIEDNYDHLRIGDDAISRDIRYTRYVDDQLMLRSHSSAMVPPALRSLAADPDDDVLLVCPGIVYRRDAIDWQHTGTPHQLDLWRVSRRPLGTDDLEEMIETLAGALTPGCPVHGEARTHPYTVSGREVDVEVGGRLVEVWECGLAHPEVLAHAGLSGWSGLALGMGLDRLLMITKAIPDIRLLRSEDPRVAQQMLDLSVYLPVSAMPAIRRDLSVALDPADDVEVLGDRVRDALGPDADAVEEVSILSETSYDLVPPAARERLGLGVGQRNVLVRVVLRDLRRTLTGDEANQLRDRIYAAIHRGAVDTWASRTDTEPPSPYR